MADDMGYGDLARVNGGLNHTPALDGLYDQSLRLSQAYAASCVCAPSRAGFLTGRYPHRTGCTCLNDIHGLNRLDPRETTLADIFSRAGYDTALIGKWHCGRDPGSLPGQRGFDHVEAFHPRGCDYWDYQIQVNGRREASQGKYLTDDLSDRTVNYLKRRDNRPFFLHLAHYAPHRPLQAPPEILQRYEGCDDLTPGQAVVYAMLESLDHAVARLLETLEKLGLADNTILVFTSDNGPDNHESGGLSPTRPNLGLRGAKYSVHDGGIRVPMMVRWPAGISGGRDSGVMMHFVDLMPTLCELCGVPIPEGLALDGDSRAEAWRGRESEVQPVRFWQWNRHYPQPFCNAAVRDGAWKLVYPALPDYNRISDANVDMILGKRPFETTRPHPLDLGPPGDPQLFQLERDPGEQHDLADTSTERVQRMTRQLEAWQREVWADLDRAIATRF